MSMQSPESYYNQLMTEIQKKKKTLKRKKTLFKIKLFFVIVLPCVLIFLLVKTAQTWIRLKLKSIAVHTNQSQDQPSE